MLNHFADCLECRDGWYKWQWLGWQCTSQSWLANALLDFAPHVRSSKASQTRKLQNYPNYGITPVYLNGWHFTIIVASVFLCLHIRRPNSRLCNGTGQRLGLHKRQLLAVIVWLLQKFKVYVRRCRVTGIKLSYTSFYPAVLPARSHAHRHLHCLLWSWRYEVHIVHTFVRSWCIIIVWDRHGHADACGGIANM